MDLLSSLLEIKNSTEKYYDLPAEALAKTYAPGKWTIKQILVHLADAEAILHDRIKRVIAEPKQVIWAFNQDLFCNNLEYESFPLHVSKALYSANRDSILFLAGKFYIKYGSKPFVHSETGLRTLKEEFDKVATHNQHHAAQILTALHT